jgi:low molecular weight phosphotyrosine protein phosphatase
MAEGVFQHLTKQSKPAHPIIANIDSAGTAAYHVGDSPDSRTMSTLADHGISTYRHAGRQVHASDFTKFEYVFAMDRSNLDDLLRLRAKEAKKKGVKEDELAKVTLFGEWSGGKKKEEIEDPYYGGREGFETAYQQCVRFSKEFLKHLEEKKDSS